MQVAIREHSHPGDLSTIVDKGAIAPRCQTRAVGQESIPVRHEAVVPKKPVRGTASTRKGIAHDLTLGVGVKCETAIITVEGSEVSHDAILPEKGEESLIVFVSGEADNLSGIIDPFGNSATPPKCAQVSERAFIPQKGMRCLISRQIRITYNLSPVVEAVGITLRASQSAKILHCAVFPKEWVCGRRPGGGVRGSVRK